MALWTDLMDPVEATGIARDEQYVLEQARGGTLARFLPNVLVPSDHVAFYPSATGLVDAARYRAFNAPPEIGKGQGVSKKTIDLPAISREEPIDEMTQKELARLSDDRIRKGIESAIRRTVQAISMRQEWARGKVIDAGSLVVDEDNFWINDVFGRDAALSVDAGAGNYWNSAAVDRLTQVGTWRDLYASKNNGVKPGRLVFGSQAAFAGFSAGNQFATILPGGATRPAVENEIRGVVSAAGLPDMEVYERHVSIEGTLTNVLDPKSVYLLPAPVDPNSEDGGVLGATYWGRTVSAEFPSWGIEPDEQPGIVCGVFKEESVGSSIEVQGDSIGEPVAGNPNAAMVIKVLP